MDTEEIKLRSDPTICSFEAFVNDEHYFCHSCQNHFNPNKHYEQEIGSNEEDYTTIQDSGARREFESGAVRDISEGKGRCDLLPLDGFGNMLGSDGYIFLCIEHFKNKKDCRELFRAIKHFCAYENKNFWTMLLEVSKHFEEGAKKYGENNWKKGIPLHCYIDSAVRHYLKHLRGDTDEPHDRAFVWNLLCAVWTFEHKPELDDIEKDLEGVSQEKQSV